MLRRLVLIGALVLFTACTTDEESPSAAGGAESESAAPTESAATGGTGGESVSVFDLEVGQCYNSPPSEENVEEVPLVDCVEPHDYEVFALVEHSAGSDEEYPGDDAIIAFAEEECAAAFEPYVGVPYLDSELEIYFLTPTADTWPVGDREVVCSAGIEGEQLEGSIEGSDR